MAVIKRIIGGIYVEFASSIRPHVGEYGVYLNKIWKVTGTNDSSGKNFRIILERQKTNEKISLNKEDFKEVKFIGYPQGEFCI